MSVHVPDGTHHQAQPTSCAKHSSFARKGKHHTTKQAYACFFVATGYKKDIFASSC